WLETESQNFPGTGDERPNWRRKARYGFETFSQMQAVSEVLRGVDNIRKQGVGDDTKKEK
ncbi:MAG: hypothetical protein MUP21_10140, partial [Dehalococcoidia bacterium]|nr:hypothetical protein [Dehalococcoidia bacterium]